MEASEELLGAMHISPLFSVRGGIWHLAAIRSGFHFLHPALPGFPVSINQLLDGAPGKLAAHYYALYPVRLYEQG